MDQEQQLSLSDERPLPVYLLADVPLHLRFDVSVDESIQAPDPLAVDGHVPLQDARDLNSGRRRWRKRRRLVASGARQEERDDLSVLGHPRHLFTDRAGAARAARTRDSRPGRGKSANSTS